VKVVKDWFSLRLKKTFHSRKVPIEEIPTDANGGRKLKTLCRTRSQKQERMKRETVGRKGKEETLTVMGRKSQETSLFYTQNPGGENPTAEQQPKFVTRSQGFRGKKARQYNPGVEIT